MDTRERLSILRALGHTSTRPRRTVVPVDIRNLVGGEWVDTEHGPYLVRETVLGAEAYQGRIPLRALLETDPGLLSLLARDDRLAGVHAEQLLFVDTETTGLMGGTGTYVFLIGAGFFKDGHFVLRQYFMPEPRREKALLAGFRESIEEAGGFVTFNGRQFDLPLLQARSIIARMRFSLTDRPNLDLLYPARRVWRGCYEGCGLSVLEKRVLGAEREEDVPSYLIPSLYFDYLRGGDPEPLTLVFEHNAQDVISMVALATVLARGLDAPGDFEVDDGRALFNLARYLHQLGFREKATAALEAALTGQEEGELRDRMKMELSYLYRRTGRWPEAAELWTQMARRRDGPWLQAMTSLAKYFEHRAHDLPRARAVVVRALQRVELDMHMQRMGYDQSTREALLLRLARVERKMGRQGIELKHLVGEGQLG